MSYNIVVCIKQVPHPESFSKITLDSVSGTIRREGLRSIINPLDKHALEEAIRIREKSGGKVTALTMGPPQARKALEEALAMGADDAIHLCDRAFAGADSLATAQTLASEIRKIGQFDLILCGNTTVDSGTGQVAPQLAYFLDLACATEVENIVFESEHNLLLKRGWERGYIKIRVKLPAVIAVTNKINQPRIPTVFGIMSVAQKEIKTWGCADLSADVACLGLSGSPTQFLQIGQFSSKRHNEILNGSTDDIVDQAVQRLVKLELI